MGLFDLFKKKPISGRKESKTADISGSPVCVNMVFSKNTEDILPIEKRIKGESPLCDGLFPHEILVLSYAPKFYDSNNTFQSFWWYKYGIRDVQEVLDSLLRRSYIELGSIADAVSLEKIPVIKEELQRHGLKVSGKKADLVERLIDNVPEAELSARFERRPYVLTESGSGILKKYEWIPFIHAHGIEDLDIWNLTEMVQTPPHMNYRDKIWRYLNNRGIEHIQAGNYGQYRNSRFTMSEFVADEDKPRTAFSLLCEVIAYDLSGLSNGFRMGELSIYASSYFPYEQSIVTMAPGITTRIGKYKEQFNWSDAELKEHLLEELGKYQLPFRLFTVEECADIVLAELYANKGKLAEIYSAAEKSFKKQYKKKLGAFRI